MYKLRHMHFCIHTLETTHRCKHWGRITSRHYLLQGRVKVVDSTTKVNLISTVANIQRRKGALLFTAEAILQKTTVTLNGVLDLKNVLTEGKS